MKLGFSEPPPAEYDSGSQQARVLTEAWAGSEAYCPNCGNSRLSRFANNRPVADLYCDSCHEEFELKSQKSKFGSRVADGAYSTMMERLGSQNHPNLMLLNYNNIMGVRNLFVVPKHFFVKDLIERRKPLAEGARRAGWVGCNILLSRVPQAGKIFIVREGAILDRHAVLEQWRRTTFLRGESETSRGWLLNVLRCAEQIGRSEFTLQELYAFEHQLTTIYPSNKHIREKIRQQLQVLRGGGIVSFKGRGRYELTGSLADRQTPTS